MSNISLEGLDKAAVLAALYNASKPQGMGFMQYNPAPMTTEEAAELLKGHTYFDYLQGRVMKIDLGGEELDPWGYDRDNGQGAALRAIEAMESGDSDAIQAIHLKGVSDAAHIARDALDQESESTTEDGVINVTLGLADVADVLAPAIERAVSE